MHAHRTSADRSRKNDEGKKKNGRKGGEELGGREEKYERKKGWGQRNKWATCALATTVVHDSTSGHAFSRAGSNCPEAETTGGTGVWGEAFKGGDRRGLDFWCVSLCSYKILSAAIHRGES